MHASTNSDGFEIFPTTGPVTQTWEPESLHVKVGKLEIVHNPGGDRLCPACGHTRVLLDGEPLAVSRIVLTGDARSLWTAEVTFYPEHPKAPKDE